jgi:uncharacterized protein YcaQ
MSTDALSLLEARRIALAAQGFDRPRPAAGAQKSHVRQTIRRLGLLQLDYVNVVVPSHYQVLFARLGPYPRSHLDEVVYPRAAGRPREFTEQWAHEASILPVETWPLLRHRMEAHRVRPYGFERALRKLKDYADWVLSEVRARGPLAAEDLPGPAGLSRKIEGSWNATVPRAVLEAYFGRGVLAVAERRKSMARAFDLAERLVPAPHHSRRVEKDAAQRELLRLAARAHGIGAAADLADYYRMPVKLARARLAELVAERELLQVSVEGWREPAYLAPTARAARTESTRALLSPFDPLIWFRARTRRLFDFDFRFEIFVPEEKRRWGCYVLPFLLGERLVARVDLKADRARDHLRVEAAYLEPHADVREVAPALAEELATMAKWLGLVPRVSSRRGNLARALGAALKG